MITFATLPVELRTDGSALFHLLRNLGSSIGIALAVTYLTCSTQHNRAELAEFAPRGSTRSLRAPGLFGDWDLSSQAGLAAIELEINRQASMIAYVNDFHVMTLLALAAKTPRSSCSPRNVRTPQSPLSTDVRGDMAI